ncbi:transmembrane amino acid transporter protein-domain-containing protein [Epithele typhae]|uniref:transmembrane amino acid transporter protein-domain-containing protein n=1 Tax=Epithele typhae TaxID=378194 RepID=UPI00200841B6|nr:transmembrane amino acid transporter protein-domain-containing protein [Epithele typhae]KAH9945045.1 transmembrane amino acid transporter protein-domain-containing protein [Epithele typhae]
MSSPSKPFDIPSPRRGQLVHPNATPPVAGTPNFGTGLSASPSPRFLRAQYTGTPPLPNIPPRSGATPIGTPSSTAPFLPGPSAEASSSNPAFLLRPGSGTPGSDANPFDDLTDEEKARILRRHLVSRDQRQNNRPVTPDIPPSASSQHGSQSGNLSHRSSASHIRLQREDTEPFPVPYDAHGADITHSIYKWQADKRRQAARPRSASFAGSTNTQPLHPALEHIHEPGGFRRTYVALNDPERASNGPMARNFIEFLYIFGHFAGEDLEEIDEEDEADLVDEEALPNESSPFLQGGTYGTHATPSYGGRDSSNANKTSERSPLLERSSANRSRSRRRAASVGPHGDATVTDAVLMLLKAFVGTGILFLGKAFFNGGILFSSAVLTFIALVSLHSFLLLVKTKFVVSGSFGDIGGALYGPWMRYAILASITISQLGFVSAYIIFVSENLQSFVLAITNCAKLLGIQYFILLQMIIFLPLALIRNLAKLSTTALIADVFILAGLIYIFGSEAKIIAHNGIAHVELFNPKDWPLLIGTAVFSFEGIGLVIPVTDAMREPRKFPAVLTGVMLFLMVLFCGGGVMSYLTFGADVQTVVIVNLDTTSRFTQVVQFFYSLAILLSVPLQLFPAVRIMENGLFERSGKGNVFVKWQKNIFRFFVVAFCAVLSYFGAADLDKFVSFIGSFACVPLCYVYPAMLHYKACARTRKEKLADIALMVFGMIAAAYTTIQTVRLMSAPASAAPPVLGQCGQSPEEPFRGLL